MIIELSYSDILNKLFLHNNVLMIKHNNKNLIVDTVNIIVNNDSINELYKILISLNYKLPPLNDLWHYSYYYTLNLKNNTVLGKTFLTTEENLNLNNIVISQTDFVKYYNKI